MSEDEPRTIRVVRRPPERPASDEPRTIRVVRRPQMETPQRDGDPARDRNVEHAHLFRLLQAETLLREAGYRRHADNTWHPA